MKAVAICEACGVEFTGRRQCGVPPRYCSRACHARSRGGAGNPNWKGGVHIADDYVKVHMPGHPSANTWGYVNEHILVAERAFGRRLPKGVVVHHVNEQGHDNRNENLVICENQAYHALLHTRMRARAIQRGQAA